MFVFIGLLCVGSISIGIGISCLLGYRRFEYIFPHYYSSGITYASIPLGIMAIIWAFAFGLALSEGVGLILTCVSLGFGLIGLLFNFTQPAFLKPKWYRWLKKNHGDIMPWLRQDVRRMGYDEWKKRTKTIAELEDWATEVRRRYRWEIETIKRQEGIAL
jgi:hypothetical protein